MSSRKVAAAEKKISWEVAEGIPMHKGCHGVGRAVWARDVTGGIDRCIIGVASSSEKQFRRCRAEGIAVYLVSVLLGVPSVIHCVTRDTQDATHLCGVEEWR